MINKIEESKKTRLISGVVISKKMEKTATVQVERVYMNKRVHKIVRVKKKLQVHDPENKTRIGDVVEFYEGKPVSKTKFMYLHRIIANSKFNIEDSEGF
jgi:small subunit ribosomal protein S17